MDESRFDQSMLLDFYGELLTEKQRDCFDLHYNEDLSLSEIAEQLGISRQGVWDNIRRAESAMREIEEKTGLIARFEDERKKLETVSELVKRLCGMTDGTAGELAAKASEMLGAMLEVSNGI